MTDMIGDFSVAEHNGEIHIRDTKKDTHMWMPRDVWFAMAQPSVIKRRGGLSKDPNRGRAFYEIYTWGEHVPEDDPRHEQLKWEGLKDYVQARWNAVYDEARIGRCGYNQFEPDNGTSELTPEEALEGVNLIRNSIIGAQTFNWSEHMYPLVSLLNRAGFEGLKYPEARANIHTMIERIEALKRSLTAVLDWAAKMPGFHTNDAVRAAQELLEVESR